MRHPPIFPALILSFSMLAPFHAGAAGPGSPNALIPYKGHLDLSGAPANGAHDFRVTLFSNAAGTTQVYTEDHAGVAVSAGNFALSIGSVTPLPNTTFNNNELYLRLAVRRVGDAAFTTLEGLQQLGAAPYAVRAEGGKDLAVTGNVSVGGSLQAGLVMVENANNSATCPTGTKAIGGGGDCDNNSQGVSTSRPLDAQLSGWYSACTGSATPRRTYAICARIQ